MTGRRRADKIPLRRIWADQCGSHVVELALTLPVLLTLIYGVMECSRIVFTYAALNFAAEEATRYATVNYDASIMDIENIAKSRLIVIDPAGIISFDVTSELDTEDQTKLVTVEIAYAFQPVLPIAWGSFSLTGHSRGFRIDQ
jgi:Flp pilus assembly protein TadG